MSKPKNRMYELKAFIDSNFPGASDSISPIFGDAGLRDYYRIKTSKNNYVVMDCPVDYCSIEPFIKIANYLNEHNFSAPKIIANDIKQGFLILEDFGDISLKEYILKTKSNESIDQIYHLIIDLLISLQTKELPKNIDIINNDKLISDLDIFVDYYIPYKYGRILNKEELSSFKNLWKDIMLKRIFPDNVISLRDYHVENMMYLENREHIKQLGLLDFQDATCGSPIYDLVSVLEDARIDVPRNSALKYIKHFSNQKNFDENHVIADYSILGAQRNMRVLGVFVRKLKRDKDDSYLQYLPRVEEYLKCDLSHDVMKPINNWLNNLNE